MNKKITKHAKDLITLPNQEWNVSDITLAKEILIRFRNRELARKKLQSEGITISVELKQLVDEQANDEGLWCQTKYASEAYLQTALRQLHAAIEGISPEDCALAVLAGEQHE